MEKQRKDLYEYIKDNYPFPCDVPSEQDCFYYYRKNHWEGDPEEFVAIWIEYCKKRQAEIEKEFSDWEKEQSTLLN